MSAGNTDHDTTTASDSDDVEFLRETYRGRDVFEVYVEPSTMNEASVPTTPFRFLDLPAELRCHVYSFVLPSVMTITFEDFGYKWAVRGQYKGDNVVYNIGSSRQSRHVPVETQLFRVGKSVSNECRAVLYGSNTFRFNVHGESLFPQSLRNPFIFGAFGGDGRLRLLRNLRSIHIDFPIDISYESYENYWTVKRQRSRLEYFVEILKEHVDDESQKSLLQALRVKVQILPYAMAEWVKDPPRQLSVEKFMFGMESLASLRGIKNVQIIGLPDWYTACLQLAMQGQGGEVKETDWPLVEVKRRNKSLSKRRSTHSVTTRKWYHPTLNWKEFAERNNIAIPEDIDKYWAFEY